MPRQQLTIGQLAAAVQLRTSALRYYEQVGLVPPPDRVGGHRVYPASTIRRIALIKMAQQAGFRLAEIRALLAGGDAGSSATRQWRALAERKLPEIDTAIDRLRLLRAVVADCLTCGCMDFDTCELLKAVDHA